MEVIYVLIALGVGFYLGKLFEENETKVLEKLHNDLNADYGALVLEYNTLLARFNKKKIPAA